MGADDPSREPTLPIVRDGARRPPAGANFRLGPYEVLRGLVRAPGAWLVEGRGPQAETALIQLVHCRPEPSGTRSAFERRIARETAAIVTTDGIDVRAHGCAARDDGSRLLYWALPWPAAAEHVTDATDRIADLDHLIDVGARLANRLAERHARGKTDPLLSERVLLIRRDDVVVLGVPVFVPPAHLSDDMEPGRRAPEERASGAPGAAGDVWRLGHALTALSSRFETVPERFSSVLERMTRHDPSGRPPRARDLELELRRLQTGLDVATTRITTVTDVALAADLDRIPTLPVGPNAPRAAPPTAPRPVADDPIDGEDEPLVVAVTGSESLEPVDTDLDPPADRPSPRRSALTALIGAAVGIAATLAFGAWGSHFGEGGTPARLTVTAANDLVVTASPPDAVVVSELDGRVLGPVPLLLMVPEGLSVAVLVAADAYEPQRLVLPSRGSVSTNLLKLPADADRCVLPVVEGPAGAYEGVRAIVEVDGGLAVDGAAVVRKRRDSAGHAGAWLVRCPRFGGTGQAVLEPRPRTTASIEVTGPTGAVVLLDAEEVGVVPVERQVDAAFTEVTLRDGHRTISRWVPTVRDVAVSLSFDQ